MEQTAQTRDGQASPGTAAGDGHRAEQRRLRVGDIMSKEVITAAPDETVFSAVTRMSEHGVSCLVITDDRRVTGILTERDVLQGVAQCDTDFRRVRVSEQMSSPVEVIPADSSILEAAKRMDAQGIKRLPVVKDGQLVGIVTQMDITRGLISLSVLRYVSDIMTRQVATVDAEATADEAARLMSGRNISCLVILHREEAAGILTEKDLLRRVVALHRTPAQTRVAEIMSFPVVAIPPSYSILGANKKMETMHVHRLVVMDAERVCGIVTQTDILRAIRTAFEAVESQRGALVRQVTDLVQYIARDVEKVQEFLSGVQNPSAAPGKPTAATGSPPEERESILSDGPCIL